MYINIAFCFDDKIAEQVQVTVASLLDHTLTDGVHYHIYCICTEHPAIIHYAGDKPWKRYDTNLGYLWWDYVNSQPDLQGLFDEKKARKYHGPTLFERAVRKIKKLISKEKL